MEQLNGRTVFLSLMVAASAAGCAMRPVEPVAVVEPVTPAVLGWTPAMLLVIPRASPTSATLTGSLEYWPLYSVTTQTGALDDAAKAKLARELTTLHSDYAGVPKSWVHVVFQDYAPGSGFTAGEASACASLTLLIRTGRSPAL